jgi:hypothetical protein
MLGPRAAAESSAEESGRFWKKPGSTKENGFAMRRRKKVCEEYKQQI